MANYYDGVNVNLLNTIKPGAKQVLELGCANGRLGEQYKASNPGTIWTGIEYQQDCIRNAIPRLDNVVWMDLNTPHSNQLTSGIYDTIVAGDVLEHLINPEQCLQFLHSISTPEAALHICVPNMTHFSVYEKLLMGDTTYDPHGLMDETHLRFMSYSSTYKMLINAGWLPHLNGVLYSQPGNERDWKLYNGLCSIGESLGIPKQTVERNLSSFQLIISAIKSPSAKTKAGVPISVIVPMNNPKQFDLNIIRSGGLHEIGAQLIPIDAAPNASAALDRGKGYCNNRWILFCHQDVYVPAGSGYILSEIISSIPEHEWNNTLIGFAGISGTEYAGLVIDRQHRYDYPRSSAGTSLDEFAILLTADSLHKIDPDFGWHGWGTDMCIVAQKMGYKVHIERVPFFHNSLTVNGATSVFNSSIEMLKKKHAGYGKLTATTGTFFL